jgi:histone arginine demethylase JMJD6
MFTRRRTAERISKAKSAHRADIKVTDWNQSRYSEKDICERLMQIDPGQPGFHPVAAVDAATLSPDEFMEKYASARIPVIIRGALSEWPAMAEGRWDIPVLLKRFKHTLFKVGEDDSGRKLKVKMKTFMDYMSHQTDDSPLYLFESGMIGETASLREDYWIPKYFPDDYLNLVGRDNKPPHRWFCIGPKRSGTTVHRDPIGTAAWNAVTMGYKRWVLFEPKEDRMLVKAKKYRVKGEDDEAINYFDYMLPRMRAANPNVKVYECIQCPGDLIFVPGQWWHGVLNLSDTVAVTHNYCGRVNFDDVCKRTARQRPVFFKRWTHNMKKFSPALYKKMQHIQKHPEEGTYVDCESSASSSDSSDSSDYSSSEDMSDIEWVGFPTKMDIDN